MTTYRRDDLEDHGKQVAYSDAGKEVAYSEGLIAYGPQHSTLEPVIQRQTTNAQVDPWSRSGSDAGQDEKTPSSEQRAATMCGMPKRIFWIVAVVFIVLFCVAIGGGVGGALAASRNNSSAVGTSAPQLTSTSTSSLSPTTASRHTNTESSSSLPPSSTSSAVTSGTTGMASYTCTDQKTYNAPGGEKFRAFCRQSTSGNQALAILTRYSFQSCIDACADWSGVTTCTTLTYNANLTSSIAGQGGNCFLKAKGDLIVSLDYVASAVREL